MQPISGRLDWCIINKSINNQTRMPEMPKISFAIFMCTTELPFGRSVEINQMITWWYTIKIVNIYLFQN